ncbi:MAG: hypothetical protein F6K58_07920 [Symploca sp. SIO2E9]|nr:hypothetical protein [Symploca sp. SIO2E9]
MPYLTEAAKILATITKFATAKIIWADTEVADWDSPNPRLSLIQLLAEPTDINGDCAYVLDVLDKPELVTIFVNQIMANPNIEKVFHYAKCDLHYLGGKKQAKNVTCTFNLVKKLTQKKRCNPLKVSNKKLKTLAVELCQFSNVDAQEQTSDWGQRPLTEKQLKYAKMDTVYLAHVHRRLLELAAQRKVEKFQHIPFSVTHVRVALECPRLFYFGYRFRRKTMFVPSGKSVYLGSAFNDLSEQFVHIAQQEPQFCALFEPHPEQLQVEQIAAKMQELFYQFAFFPYLQTFMEKNPGRAEAVSQLWQELSKLIQRWAGLLLGNRRYCSSQEVIRKTFIIHEPGVEYNFSLANGTQQLLTRRLDSLAYDFENRRLYLVEYQTYKLPDKSAQLAQVALYSYMLREQLTLSINSVVCTIVPEWQELTFSQHQLAHTLHQLIPQTLQQMRQWAGWEHSQPNPPPPTSQAELLCDICPQRHKCQTFFVVGVKEGSRE